MKKENIESKPLNEDRNYIKIALNEYLSYLHEALEVFEKDVKMIDTLTDEQIARILWQWFHIDNALDQGTGMFSEGVGRLHDEITGEESEG